MNIHPEFSEFLQLLEENQVDYMIVGGYAVGFHGYPRFTQDIDIFYDNAPANVERLRNALVAFGFEYENLPVEGFTKTGNILTFGVPPLRVDLLNDIDGVKFKDAKPGSVRSRYGDGKATFIGREDLLRNKLATKRASDKIDVEEIRKRNS